MEPFAVRQSAPNTWYVEHRSGAIVHITTNYDHAVTMCAALNAAYLDTLRSFEVAIGRMRAAAELDYAQAEGDYRPV